MKRYLLLLILISVTIGASADQLLLRVEVTNQEYTGRYPGCKTEREDETCIPMHFWFIFKARVIDVIDGEFKPKEIQFAQLQHAHYVDEYVKDVYVVVEEFENKETSKLLETKYFSKHMSFPKKIVCIPKEIVETFESQSKFEDPITNTSCFETSDFEPDDEDEADDA